MDLSGMYGILRRRKWVVAGTLLAATVAGGAVYTAAPSSYAATSYVLFLSSQEQAQPAGGNPYLSFNGSLVITAEVVSRSVGDPTVAARIKATGVGGDYQVALTRDSAGPMLTVDVTARTAADALATRSAVLGTIDQTLESLQRQTGAAPSTWIRTARVIANSPAKAVHKSKIQLGGATFVVVALLGFLLILWREVRATRPRTRRGSRRAASNVPVEGDGVSADGPAAAPRETTIGDAHLVDLTEEREAPVLANR